MKSLHKARPVSPKVPGNAALLVLPLLMMMFVSWPVRSSVAPQPSPYTEARWMRKLQARQTRAASTNEVTSSSFTVGTNVNVSNEPNPQSEVFIAVDTQNPSVLAGGSNEIFRNPQRRSEEHTSELQSLTNLVCRLLLEKTKQPFSMHCCVWR